MEPRKSVDDEAQGAADSIDLRHYWAVIKKRRWIILATVVIAAGLQFFVTSRKPRIYQATATVVVNLAAPKAIGNEGEEVVQLGAGSGWFAVDYFNTQQRIITSRKMAERLVHDCKLSGDQRLMPKAAPDTPEDKLQQMAVKAVHGIISARLIRESRIIAISVQHTDPDLAADVANCAAQVYMEQNIEVKQVITRDANRWVAERLDAAEKSLKTSETEVVSYKTKNGILSVSLEDRQNQVSRDLEMYGQSYSQTQKTRGDLESKRKHLGKLFESDLETFATTVIAGAGDKSVTSLAASRDAYVLARIELQKAETRYGPKHEDVIVGRQIFANAEADLKKSATSIILALDQQINEARDNETKYRTKLEELKAEAFELNKKAHEYKELTRTAEMDEQVYRSLAQRLTESALQEQDKANNIVPLDRAETPRKPIAPDHQADMIMGVALGLALALGLAFGIEFLDRSVKGQEDVESRLGLPFLGMVPSVESTGNAAIEQKGPPELYIARNPNSTVAECCRVLRTNILFSSPDKPLRTLLVSSSNQSEGKTTTVINLGITMAQSGHRTLLVDTDMRRPRLHKGLGVSNEKGVSGVVVGEYDIEAAIKTTDVPNMYVLPCGPIPPNPAELLQTERFQKLLETLAERYDRVILDSPPILAVTDAVISSRLVDGMVLVVRASKTSYDAVLSAKRALGKVKARIVGVVLNDVNLRSPHYSAYYNYYQYGGYHEAPATAKKGA
jgi:capsular exopolysaccharide synthesis family protein